MAVQTLLTDHGIGWIRWAPGGTAFAVVVQSGLDHDDRVDVFSADGQRHLAMIEHGWDVAWLDPTTLAVLLEYPDGTNGQVTIHDLGGGDHLLDGRRGAILGSGSGQVAVTDPFAFNGEYPQVFRLLTHSPGASASAAAWVEGEPTGAGWPMAWSGDGSLLAVQAPTTASASSVAWRGPAASGTTGRIRLAAGSVPPVRVHVLRYPGGAAVPMPDLLVDPRGEWTFSPDDRWFAVGPMVVDLRATKVTRLDGYDSVGWTPQGDLTLIRYDPTDGTQSSARWHPDGTITSTGLPAGSPVFGPLPGEVVVAEPDSSGQTNTGRFEIRMAGQVVDIPTVGPPGPWEVAWSPDGRSCLIGTPTDDAQQSHAKLLLVTAP